MVAYGGILSFLSELMISLESSRRELEKTPATHQGEQRMYDELFEHSLVGGILNLRIEFIKRLKLMLELVNSGHMNEIIMESALVNLMQANPSDQPIDTFLDFKLLISSMSNPPSGNASNLNSAIDEIVTAFLRVSSDKKEAALKYMTQHLQKYHIELVLTNIHARNEKSTLNFAMGNALCAAVWMTSRN